MTLLTQTVIELVAVRTANDLMIFCFIMARKSQKTQDFFALFLFKQLSPARPDLLRQLVMRERCEGEFCAGENAPQS